MNDQPTTERLFGDGPHHPVAAGLRFVLEVTAWLAIWQVWGWLAFLAGVLALALFNARGDKRVQGIVVPGALRIFLELGVLLLGCWAMARWLGGTAAALMLLALVAMIVIGRERYRWLLRR